MPKRPTAKTLFVLGTASHSGKSVITAGLCRHFRRQGLRVAPFKSQNMALNSAVTPAGEEMGRAQAVQAEACKIEPRVEMNPILLKPTGDHRIQVVLRGRVHGTMSAEEYYSKKSFFLEQALECHRRLAQDFDLIVAEGAGSPVEVNLLDRDIVNLPLARLLDAPCLLVADIDRGGVFASLVGTRELCAAEDQRRIQGFIINKFRGRKRLFEEGLDFLQERTGWPCLGVVPFCDWLGLEEEDSVALASKPTDPAPSEALRVVVLRLPHLSNYTDFDPLERCGVQVLYARSALELRQADLILLPGSKNTIEDLLWLKSRGLWSELLRAVEDGAYLMGICGGFQMMGRSIQDPRGVESTCRRTDGLALFDMETILEARKTTCRVEAMESSSGLPLKGYEIHMGRSLFNRAPQPFLRIRSRSGQPADEPEGAVSGRIMGTYVHGLFDNPAFAQSFLEQVATGRGKEFTFREEVRMETMYDLWADTLEQELDLALLHRIARLG